MLHFSCNPRILIFLVVLCYCSWPNPMGLFHLHLLATLQASSTHISIRSHAMWLNKIHTLTFRLKVFLSLLLFFNWIRGLHRFLNRSYYNSNRRANTYSNKQIKSTKTLFMLRLCASSGYRTKSVVIIYHVPYAVWLNNNRHRHI